MSSEPIKRITRDRLLTPDEATKYNEIRGQIDKDLPNLIAQYRAHFKERKVLVVTSKTVGGGVFTTYSLEDEEVAVLHHLDRARFQEIELDGLTSVVETEFFGEDEDKDMDQMECFADWYVDSI